ncbi:MAG TPA: MraY family glycosyltransferase [Pirellulales bacterium]|jgi:UDP-GlcNAc:undecaprenyl-phosphate GlcNAc-1-phosphate transferase
MIPWLVLGAVVPAAFVAALAAGVVRRGAPAWGLVDEPGHRKVHVRTTPLGGGIAIWLGVVLPMTLGQIVLWLVTRPADTPGLAWASRIPIPEFVRPHLSGLAQQAPQLWFLLAAGTVLMLLGLADDLWGLSWRPRLAVQFGIAILVVWRGWHMTMFVNVPWLTSIVSVLWIVALVNSFNMLDNMDGLSAGVAAIASAILAAVLLITHDPQTAAPQLFVAGFLLVLVGSLLGFLSHNRPPAKIFMGDAGSYFIGFYVAVATIMATFSGGDLPRHSILAPLCVMAVPFYDMLTVILIRIRSGRSPFEADKNHFSHRLVELGMTKVQAVATIYLLTATCGLGALLLHQVDEVGAVIVSLLVTCVLLLVAVLETTVRVGQNQRTKR